MDWKNIISEKRTGVDSKKGPRTEYQRDFDRLIFSSAFRRLQNKTQVFPLPGSAFVHTRLTHSLEVASVGRSLGKIVGEQLTKKYRLKSEIAEFYKYELPSVISAACLAHDIGNPAFGHSGEKAISQYFIDHSNLKIERKKLIDYFRKNEWCDLVSFEGNANALRILTNQFRGKSSGGYRLTYTTLASMIKYPWESSAANKKATNYKKKYGFFQPEKEIALDIFHTLHLIEQSTNPIIYKRHPFVYLTEAADDICYRIVDMEDAHRLGILYIETVQRLFLNLLKCISRPEEKMEIIERTLESLNDPNEKIAYLRAKCINVLTLAASDIFLSNSENVINGKFHDSLVGYLEKECWALKEIDDLSKNEIYNHKTVVEIELAGYNLMSDLLKLFIPAILKDKPEHKDEKILRLIPNQFITVKSDPYSKALSVLDYISGMTDSYATELYRKIYGIEIPKH